MKIEEEARTIYVCDFCGHRFAHEDMCRKHEEDHKIENEFRNAHKPRFSKGDIVESDGIIYKVVNIDLRVESFYSTTASRRAMYLYVLRRAYDVDDEGDYVENCVTDYLDGREFSVRLIASASDAEKLYEEINETCNARCGINAREIVRAMEA